MEHQTAIIRLVSFPVVCGEARRFLYASSYPIGFLGGGSETTGLPVAGAAFRPQGAPRVNRNKRRKRQRTVAPIEVAEGGNRSLGRRPASTQKRAAGFGRQFKNCTPSAAPRGRRSPERFPRILYLFSPSRLHGFVQEFFCVLLAGEVELHAVADQLLL